MNFQADRVNFNKSRGCMMAVFEVASGHGKGKSRKMRQPRIKRCKKPAPTALNASKVNLSHFYPQNTPLAQAIYALLATNLVVKAGNNALLAADNAITLQAAKNESSQTSTNSNSSSSIGVSYGVFTGTVGFSASASKGQGSGNGQDTSFSNTQVTSGNTATIQSGGDTALKGAVVAANQIKADIGGNLNIESLQDKTTYTSSQSSAGASVSFGGSSITGGSVNAAKSNINSNFQSVGEQSGLKAGDGGFQVNAAGNTDLKGSVIASTQAAVDANKNSFTTGGSLIITDIQNTASFSGTGYSVGASYGVGDVKDASGKTSSKTTVGGSTGYGSTGGNAASTSSAGISGIAGNTAVRTGDANTGLTRIFDADKVQREINAQIAITSAFGQQASKAIGDYAQTQTVIRDKKRAEATDATGDRKIQLLREAQAIDDNWGSTGTIRLLAHIVVGGLTGGLGGAAGAAAGTLAAPAVAGALKDAGIDGGLASTIIALASTAAGAIAGGAAGGTGSGVAGAGAAFNEVVNNYLSHNRPSMLRLSEREKYAVAAAGCAAKDAAACKLRD